jgi:hypothetical protein
VHAEERSGLDRRTFVRRMSATAAVLLAHPALPGFAAARRPPTGADEPLIRSLRLLTAAPLAALRSFYHDRIGFPVLEESAGEIAFATGATRLAFQKAGAEQREPFYHFAFNVPPDRIRAARTWQLERSALVPAPDHLRDPAHPDDVWHFRHWNAHSVFFFDPAFNIVEYIARHDLPNAAPDPERFSTADIRYASEIGYVFAPSQQAAATRMLRERLGLAPYPDATNPWWAMGDERGLLLCLARKGELWGENTSTPVRWDVFPTDVTIRGHEPGAHAFEGFPYRVRVEQPPP